VQSNTNSIYILVQKNHAKPLWSKGAKHTLELLAIDKWYKICESSVQMQVVSVDMLHGWGFMRQRRIIFVDINS